MTAKDVAEIVSGQIVAGEKSSDREVLGAYCSDLLSDVMANAQKGDAWITLQRHANIVAVAHLNDLACIVLVNGRLPEDACKTKADEVGIPIISSPLSAFDIAGLLYSAGLRGRKC